MTDLFLKNIAAFNLFYNRFKISYYEFLKKIYIDFYIKKHCNKKNCLF